MFLRTRHRVPICHHSSYLPNPSNSASRQHFCSKLSNAKTFSWHPSQQKGRVSGNFFFQSAMFQNISPVDPSAKIFHPMGICSWLSHPVETHVFSSHVSLTITNRLRRINYCTHVHTKNRNPRCHQDSNGLWLILSFCFQSFDLQQQHIRLLWHLAKVWVGIPWQIWQNEWFMVGCSE